MKGDGGILDPIESVNLTLPELFSLLVDSSYYAIPKEDTSE